MYKGKKKNIFPEIKIGISDRLAKFYMDYNLSKTMETNIIP